MIKKTYIEQNEKNATEKRKRMINNFFTGMEEKTKD